MAYWQQVEMASFQFHRIEWNTHMHFGTTLAQQVLTLATMCKIVQQKRMRRGIKMRSYSI